MTRRDYGSGSIKERSPRRWRIELQLSRDPLTGKRRRRRFTVRGAKRDAQRALREALNRRDQGIEIPANRITVSEWLTSWLSRYRAEGHISAMTESRYQAALRTHVLPVIGHIRLQELRRDQILEMRAGWLTGEGPTTRRALAAATVRKQLMVLRQGLDLAIDSGIIARNPATGIKAPPLPPDGEKRALTEAELRLLIDAAGGTRLQVPVRFAVATGLRESELLALRWGDLESHRSVVHVRRSLSRIGKAEYNEPKSRSRRTLELSEATIELLRRHRVTQNEHRLQLGAVWEDHDLIFASLVGTPWMQRNFYRDFKAVLAKTEIADQESVTWHTLRHTAASHWLMAGVTPFEVARRLGHSSTNITERVYAHLLPGGQQKSAHVMDHLIG